MCGIALHFNPAGSARPLDLGLLRHRGPDSNGSWGSADGHCWLGHTRLAIVDLSDAGAQPLCDPATGNVLIFNGEIYNHADLRRELSADGRVWRGTSDTETLLAAFGRWGAAALPRLKGMFAFALYEAASGRLFAARDRLGIKPLYFTRDGPSLWMASEMRALRGTVPFEPEPRAISAYLASGACPEACLLFPRVESLPAGHLLRVGPDSAVEIERYWPTDGFLQIDGAQPAVRVRELIERAVEEHLLADVPVASFLSGGLDSSIITVLAARHAPERLKTFSVGFKQAQFDETRAAEEVAQRCGAEHHRIELSDEEVLRLVCEAVEKLDLPSVDAVNTYIVAREAAAHGIKVALSGLGSDEIFGGYPSFRDVPRLRAFARLPALVRRLSPLPRRVRERLADLPDGGAFEIALWRRRFWTAEALRAGGLPPADLSPRDLPELPDDFARISWAELTGYMRAMLLRDCDQMSMAVSLELRVPFLDHELVSYVLSLPAAEKRHSGRPKALLLEACGDLLPESVRGLPKRGFVLPMREWMQGPLAAFVNQGIERAVSRGVLPAAFVESARGAFAAGALHWTRLWSIVVLGHYLHRNSDA